MTKPSRKVITALCAMSLFVSIPQPSFANNSIQHLSLPLDIIEMEKSKSESKKAHEKQLRKDNPDSIVNYKKQVLQKLALSAAKSTLANPWKAYYESLPEGMELSRAEFLESGKESAKEELLKIIYEYHDNDEPTIEEYVVLSHMLPILDNIRSGFTVRGTR